MIKGDLQCVLIGQNKPLYSELVSALRGQEAHFRFRQVDNSEPCWLAKKVNPSLKARVRCIVPGSFLPIMQQKCSVRLAIMRTRCVMVLKSTYVVNPLALSQLFHRGTSRSLLRSGKLRPHLHLVMR